MSDKIRIVFFCRYLNGGGAEKHLARLVNNLDVAVFDVHLALVCKDGNYEDSLNETVQVHYLFDEAPRSATFGLIRAAKPLSRLLSTLDPNIFFSIMDYTNVFAYRGWRRSGKRGKLVFCVQSSLDQAINFNPTAILPRLTRRIVRRIYRRADRLIVLSRGVAEETIRNTRVDAARVSVINNYGLKIPAETQWKPSGDAFTVVVCGRLIPLKGFDTVIRAIGRVQQTGRRVQLQILGSGPEEARLKALAISEGVSEIVDFLGFVKRPQDYFAAASLFVLSSHFEGFGNVIVEAMSTGCPVLATDCPHGPAEIIDSPEIGVLTNVGDYEEMALRISELIDNPQRLARMAAAGFASAQRFAPAVVTERYTEVLKEVADGQ